MTTTEPITALLIEDDPTDARRIKEALAGTRTQLDGRVELLCVDSVEQAAARLARGGVDLVLLDLSLGGLHPADALARLRSRTEEVAVITLAPAGAEEAGIQSVLAGAQDYLMKDALDGRLLRRSIRYVRELHRAESALRTMTLNDELTGLYNRRGFFTHAERQMKGADRGEGLWLLLVDVDGLRHINEKFGQQEGDQALVAIAQFLKDSVRGSDIVARTAGDEFKILLVDALREAPGPVRARIDRKIERLNAQRGRRYRLSVSIGMARREPKSALSLDQLINQADDDLYRAKRARSA